MLCGIVKCDETVSKKEMQMKKYVSGNSELMIVSRVNVYEWLTQFTVAKKN